MKPIELIWKSIFAAITLAMICFSSAAYSHPITAEVDRTQINSGETFNLIITMQGQVDLNTDFSKVLQPLTNDFTIVGTSQSNEVNLSNGKTDLQIKWIVQLLPKNTGKLIIPALKIGSAATPLMTIDVSKPSNSNQHHAAASGDDDVFLETSIDPKEPYVGSQVVYTVKLFYTTDAARHWQSANLTAPEIENTVVKPLGERLDYTTQHNGHTYQVSEARYVFFPTQAGSLNIKPSEFQGEKREALEPTPNQDPFFDTPFQSAVLKPVVLIAPTVTLNVKPAPIKTNDWLPAQQVTLTEKWSADPAHFKVGQPITRTLILTAVGLGGEQLPALTLAAPPGLNIYPDQPSINTKSADKNVIGERIEKIAYVPTQAGEITLPAISLTWWNTITRKIETVSIPANTLHVDSAANTTPSTPLINPGVKLTEKNTSPLSSSNTWPWIIAALFAVAWVITFGGFWWQRKRTRNKTLPEVENPTPTVISGNSTAIKRACDKNNPQELKKEILAWAKVKWTQTSLLSLSQLADQVNTPGLRLAILELDYVLYANSKQDWNGHSFWHAFAHELKQKPVKKKTTSKVLPELHLND